MRGSPIFPLLSFLGDREHVSFQKIEIAAALLDIVLLAVAS